MLTAAKLKQKLTEMIESIDSNFSDSDEVETVSNTYFLDGASFFVGIKSEGYVSKEILEKHSKAGANGLSNEQIVNKLISDGNISAFIRKSEIELRKDYPNFEQTEMMLTPDMWRTFSTSKRAQMILDAFDMTDILAEYDLKQSDVD